MNNPWDVEAVESEQPKRGAGRPKGSLNRPVIERILAEQANTLFKEIEPNLSEEQKKYFKEAFKPKEDYDSLGKLEILGDLTHLYSVVMIMKGIKEQRSSKETAELINQSRQISVNIEDIKRKREELKGKNNDERGMVDPTRESPLDRFEGFHREPQKRR